MVHNILHTFHIERCAFFNAHAAILVEANALVCVIDVISDFLDPQLSTIVQHFRGILIIGIPPLYIRQGTAKQPKLKSLMKEEGNVLLNDALNTFYLRLYGVGHMVEDHLRWLRDSLRLVRFCRLLSGRKEMFYLTMHSIHFILRLYGVRHVVKDDSDSERGNPLSPHRLLFPISSKGSYICIIPQTG